MNNSQDSISLRLPHSNEFSIKHSFKKRLFDITFSILALTISLPFMLIIACFIRLSSKGKIIYSHERVGRGGKPFLCYKFRTMYPNADDHLQKILESSEELKNEWQQTRKLKNDPRITPIGKILRKTSLDEFPQFWNVLKGDLSVVGPRPVVQEEIEKHIGLKAPKILSVRPGLTGLWQISGRSDISYLTRIQLDEQYIDSQSLLLDVKIIAKTIPSMCSSKGAY